jgi:Tol biopolymer transport system component
VPGYSTVGRLAAIAVAAALLAPPAVAHATLAFVRNPLNPVVWVAADDGSGAHRLVAGSNPHVSPDGRTVALLHQGNGRKAQPELILAPADGSAPPSVLISGWREPFVFAWSPDAASIAAVLGPELGPKRLVLIDVVTGAQQTIAQGFFSGVSFAPSGVQLAYSRATSEDFPPRSDVYRFDIPLGQPIRYEPPVQLTHDHRSLDPLWGPNGRIVFVKQLGAKKRKYGPKNELYLMNESGKQVRRLTHTKVGPLLQGLYPTAWSADGKRLLAEFEGQDTTYGVTVNPRTGAQQPLIEATEQGFLGWALSTDGRLVLGSTRGFEPGPGNNVATIPYTGGKPRVLAKNAFEPSWSR